MKNTLVTRSCNRTNPQLVTAQMFSQSAENQQTRVNPATKVWVNTDSRITAETRADTRQQSRESICPNNRHKRQDMDLLAKRFCN